MKAAALIAAVLVVAAGAVYLATRNSSHARAPRGGGGRYTGDVTNPKKYASDAQKVGTALASLQTGGLAGVGASYAPEIGHALGLT